MEPQGCATVMCSTGSSFDICNYIIIIIICMYIYSNSSGYVMQYPSLSDRWSKSEYLIIAEESYVINVTCRCSLNRPVWTGTNGTKIHSSAAL